MLSFLLQKDWIIEIDFTLKLFLGIERNRYKKVILLLVRIKITNGNLVMVISFLKHLLRIFENAKLLLI